MNRSLWLRTGAVALPVLLAMSACGTQDSADPTAGEGDPDADGGGSQSLTIYSGRNEELVGGILEELEETTGIPIQVRFGDSAELAAQILEEGEATEADLFFSQDAGALGALGEAGMLQDLPDDVLEVAPERFRDAGGEWVATSARARVVAYDPDQVDEDELPDSFEELVDDRFAGEVGYAPTNASWQAFVTGLRVLEGEDRARELLTEFAENDPEAFENNTSILEAVDAGEVPMGLINHYYHAAMVGERGEDNVDAELHFPDGQDPLALVNIAGVGVLGTSDTSDAAAAAAEFLVSETAQQYFADETAEYPVRSGVSSTEHELPPIDELPSPDIELSELSSLDETLQMLQEVGLA